MALPRSPSAISTTDGDLDLALANGGFASNKFAIIGETERPSFAVALLVFRRWRFLFVVAADLDLDGTLDLVLGFISYRSASIPWVREEATSTRVLARGVPVGDRTQLAVADFDRDGAQTRRGDPVDDRSKSTAQSVRRMACPSSDGAAQTSCDAKAAHAMSFRSPRKLLRRSRLVHRQRLVRSGIVARVPL